MQQFTVPQFIEVEDKIIGPITVRQFIIILAGALLIFINFQIFDLGKWFFIFSVPEAFTFLVFAFYRINGRPFHFFVLNIMQTLKRPRLRIWNYKYQELNDIEIHEVLAPRKRIDKGRYYTSSRLAEISLVVDTQGVFRGGKIDPNIKRKNKELIL